MTARAWVTTLFTVVLLGCGAGDRSGVTHLRAVNSITTPSTTTTLPEPTTTVPTPTTSTTRPVSWPKTTSTTRRRAHTRRTVPAVVSGDVWARLRQCESGGNYRANTGNGFYGAYQFSAGTWNTMITGYARADIAPPSVQDDAARRLQARSGWGQWPACSRKLGLR